MAKHIDFKLPVSLKQAVKLENGSYGLKVNGVLVNPDSFLANNREVVEKFIKIYKRQIDEFAHYKSNHSILTAVAGRKGGAQEAEIAQWIERGLKLA